MAENNSILQAILQQVQMLGQQNQTMNQKLAEVSSQNEKIIDQNQELIKQNEELNLNLAVVGEFAQLVSAKHSNVFLEITQEMSPNRQKKLLAIAGPESSKLLAIEGASKEQVNTANGMSAHDYQESQYQSKKTTKISSNPSAFTNGNGFSANNQKAKSSTKKFDESKVKKIQEALKAFEGFMKPLLKGLAFKDEKWGPSIEAKETNTFEKRCSLIESLIKKAMDSDDEQYKILVQPYISALIVGKYQHSISQIRQSVDEVLKSLSISSVEHLDSIHKLFKAIPDDTSGIKLANSVIIKRDYQKRSDLKIRTADFLTTSEAECFLRLYDVAREVGLFEDISMTHLFGNLKCYLTTIEDLSRLERILNNQTTLSDSEEYFKLVKQACQQVLDEIGSGSKYIRGSSYKVGCDDLIANIMDAESSLKSLRKLLDENQSDAVDSIKSCFKQVIDQTRNYFLIKAKKITSVKNICQLWFDFNEVALKEIIANQKQANESSSSNSFNL